MLNSQITEGARVPFPAHTGERVYMEPFVIADGLPERFTRWQPTVDAMLDGVSARGVAYLMIDQGALSPGQPHRRGGAHVDGNWIADLRCHGNPPHHRHPAPGHGHSPLPSQPRHVHAVGRWSNPPHWAHPFAYAPERLCWRPMCPPAEPM